VCPNEERGPDRAVLACELMPRSLRTPPQPWRVRESPSYPRAALVLVFAGTIALPSACGGAPDSFADRDGGSSDAGMDAQARATSQVRTPPAVQPKPE
jgi:hypothetical protein